MAGIFSRFIFNNAIFNTSGGSPDTGGGGVGGFDFNKYRSHLEELSRLHSESTKSKHIRKVKKVVKLVKKLAEKEPEVAELIQKVEININDYDFAAIQLEINALLLVIERMQAQYLFKIQQKEIEQENELLLLLMM